MRSNVLGGAMEQWPDPSLPGQVIVPPRPLANVNVTVDGNTGPSQLERILDILHPERNHTVPFPEEKRDAFGTPFEWAQLENTFDKRSNPGMRSVQPSAMSMLCMRMKWGPYADAEREMFNPLTPFDHLSIHLGEEKACVFIVKDGQPVTIQDDIALFPSDALIGQLHVLTGSK